MNAALHGGVGYHYPWESGTSGAEVTPETCPAENSRCHWNHLFVTAGVAYGIRLYYSTTRDYDYMVNTVYSGCEVSMNIAKFLANQAVYNPEHARYDINGRHLTVQLIHINSNCCVIKNLRSVVEGCFCLVVNILSALQVGIGVLFCAVAAWQPVDPT